MGKIYILGLTLLLVLGYAFFANDVEAAISVTLTSPNGGETLNMGEAYEITWDSSSNVDKVSIGYSFVTGSLNWIATNITNAGSYNWTVDVGNTTNTQFKIYVIAYETGVGFVDDYSDDYFNVAEAIVPSVTVTYPNGGEGFSAGKDTVSVTWTKQNISNTCGADLYKSDGSFHSHLMASASYNYFSWAISSEVESGYYKIQIYCPESGVSTDDPDYKKYSDMSDGTFMIVNSNEVVNPDEEDSPSVTVTSPNGGEQWEAGKSYNITFDSTGFSDNKGYGINLLKTDNSFYRQIVVDQRYTSFSWKIPTDVAAGQYKIEVYAPRSGVDTTDPSYKEASDISNTFTIKVDSSIARAVTVTSPNGGEVITQGQDYVIWWDVNQMPSGSNKVGIYYHRSTGLNQVIAQGVTNQNSSYGYYNWSVPSDLEVGSYYKITVAAEGYGENLSDESDTYFSIVSSSQAPSIVVNSPNGGEQWEKDKTHIISWTTVGTVAKVSVFLEDASNNVQTIAQSVPNSGSVGWKINDNISIGRYKIRVSGTDYSSASDISNNYFNVIEEGQSVPVPGEKLITITSPNGGEELEIGKQYSISWDYTGDISQVTIALQKGSQYVKNLIWNLRNNNSAVWTPDLALDPGDDYKIRITDPDTSIYDESDNYFSIISASVISAECLPDNTLIRIPDDPKVYVIINCQKKWIKTIDEFNQGGHNWTDIQEVSSPVIQAYADYLEAVANLIRAANQSRVYKIINNKRLWIPTAESFTAMGNQWSDIQDVQETEIDQYPRLKLAKLEGDSKIYYLTEGGLKRHIPSVEVFNSYGNSWADVVDLSINELDAYPDVILIKAEGDPRVYKLENSQKRWIKTAEAFNRLGFNWDEIAPVNTVEIDAYTDSAIIE